PLSRGAEDLEESRQRHRRSEEHTSELQSRGHLVCRLLLEKKKTSTSFFDSGFFRACAMVRRRPRGARVERRQPGECSDADSNGRAPDDEAETDQLENPHVAFVTTWCRFCATDSASRCRRMRDSSPWIRSRTGDGNT